MKNSSFLIHLALSAAVSFAISIAVWRLFDIFNLTGFWIASIGAALVGAAAGWAFGRRLIVTLIATVVVRGAILYFALAG